MRPLVRSNRRQWLNLTARSLQHFRDVVVEVAFVSVNAADSDTDHKDEPDAPDELETPSRSSIHLLFAFSASASASANSSSSSI